MKERKKERMNERKKERKKEWKKEKKEKKRLYKEERFIHQRKPEKNPERKKLSSDPALTFLWLLNSPASIIMSVCIIVLFDAFYCHLKTKYLVRPTRSAPPKNVVIANPYFVKKILHFYVKNVQHVFGGKT